MSVADIQQILDVQKGVERMYKVGIGFGKGQ
jgi:hypothetical protein